MLDRREGIGLGLAAAGHLVLFGILSVGFLATPNPMKLKPVPIEVSISDQVALESAAPVPSHEELAAKKSPVEAPVEPDTPPPEPVTEPEPVAKPQPAPPKPAPAPKPKPAPAKPVVAAAPPSPPKQAPAKRTVKPTGNLDGLDLGKSNSKTASTSTTPPASTIGPQVKSALGAEILRQIKPHWAPPSGADSDKLRTTVQVSLNQDGSIAGEPHVSQTGITAANRAQADLARDRAIRAVKLAAPFKLPPQYYAAWKTIAPTLYEGL